MATSIRSRIFTNKNYLLKLFQQNRLRSSLVPIYRLSNSCSNRLTDYEKSRIVRSRQWNTRVYSTGNQSETSSSSNIPPEEQPITGEPVTDAEAEEYHSIIKDDERAKGPSDQREFQAETRQLLDIVAKSLYSEKEVFIRELISNASDALEKLRYLELTGADVLNSEIPLEIHIRTDDAKKTFTLQDTGLGLTKDELVENLGTIAKSGSKSFVEQLKGKNDVSSSLIGQFGVGFYSTFMVGEKVEVYTQSYKPGEPAYKWTSDGTGSYEISEAEGVQRGSKIVVHLKGDCYDYSKEDKIKEIVKKYSNFVGVPIFLNGKKANIVEALWTREARDITEEMHEEFYRFVANAYDKPRYHMHYKTDAPLNIRALFYVPEYKPSMFDMSRDTESSVTLYSRKVMITPNASTILPKWLRFVKGVVDSEDIPLNLSRELLQDSALIRKLRIVLTNRVIKFFNDQAKKDNEKFMKFYEDYGLFLREGIVTTNEQDQREDIAKLLRFESSNLPEGERTTLNDYASRMKAGSRNIYFLSAPRFNMDLERDLLLEEEIMHAESTSFLPVIEQAVNTETKNTNNGLKRRAQEDGTPHLLLKINKPMTLNQTCSLHQGSASPSGNKQVMDTKKVPEAIPKGIFKPISFSSGKPTFITIDLETTGLIQGDKYPHITQIAATEIGSTESFSTYVLPKLPMSPIAQSITGVMVTNSGIMKVKGKEVKPDSIEIALQKLCEWLDNFPNVVLVAHNGSRFDFPVIISSIVNTNTSDLFLNSVTGLIDSLPIFKKQFPKSRNHQQVYLVQSLLNISYDAHNAISDVESLGKLVKFTNLSPEELLSYSFSPRAIHNNFMFSRETAKNIGSLEPLVKNGVCTRMTAVNIAGSGLNLGHLKTIHGHSGVAGLKDIFTAKNSEGLPRITNSKVLLDEILPKLADYFKQ